MAIRKNASTSIAAAIYKNKYNIDYNSPDFPEDVNSTDIFSYVYESDRLKSYKFTCIRDPFEKLVSGFIHKIVQNPHIEGEDYFEYNPSYREHIADIPKSFDMFLSFLEQTDINKIDVHFIPQVQSARFNQIHYNKILRVDTLIDDWAELQKDINLPNLSDNKIHFSGSGIWIEALKEQFYDRVKAIYYDDFMLYYS